MSTQNTIEYKDPLKLQETQAKAQLHQPMTHKNDQYIAQSEQ